MERSQLISVNICSINHVSFFPLATWQKITASIQSQFDLCKAFYYIGRNIDDKIRYKYDYDDSVSSKWRYVQIQIQLFGFFFVALMKFVFAVNMTKNVEVRITTSKYLLVLREKNLFICETNRMYIV